MTLQALLSHILFGLGLLGVSALLTRFMITRVAILDLPNQRSSHHAPTPKSGGIAIVGTFFLGILTIYFLADKTPITSRYFLGFLCSALAISLVSLYDDIKEKSFLLKLLTQTLAAGVVIAFGIVLDRLALPGIGYFNLGRLGYPLTLLWIVGLTNAFNFMDGLDGLAGGTAVLISLFFSYICLTHGSTFIYLVCYVLGAGALGFLFFNLPPAKIFMGDVGSAFLGFVFAVTAIIAARYDHSHTSFFVLPLLLFNFIFDTLFTFCRRLFAGEKVTQAHRTHLYQLNNQLGASHGQVTSLSCGMTVLQGIGAIFMVQIPGDKRIFVFLPFLLLQTLYAVITLRRARRRGLV